MTADDTALRENILSELRALGLVSDGWSETCARAAIDAGISRTPGEWLLADPYPWEEQDARPADVH
jgi:hypothetical protein